MSNDELAQCLEEQSSLALEENWTGTAAKFKQAAARLRNLSEREAEAKTLAALTIDASPKSHNGSCIRQWWSRWLETE